MEPELYLAKPGESFIEFFAKKRYVGDRKHYEKTRANHCESTVHVTFMGYASA
jgi:hypothetical protein